MPETGRDLKAEYDKAKQGFQDFRDNRREYDKAIFRERPVTLQPSLQAAQGNLQYQSPDGEVAVDSHVDVLMMNPTKIDAASLSQSQSEQSRQNARDIAVHSAIWWAEQNKGRWWDEAVAKGQVRYGVKVMRKMYRSVRDKMDDSDERKDHACPFYWEDVHDTSVAWLIPDKATNSAKAVWYEYEMTLIDAQKQVRRMSRRDRGTDGKFVKDGTMMMPSLTSAKRLAWLTAPEHVEDLHVSQNSGDKVHVLVRDAVDPSAPDCPVCPSGAHPRHKITEYMKGPADSWDDAATVASYDSPFPGNSFFIIPGREWQSESNPHYRYRPLVMDLLVELVWLNYLETVLAAMSRHDYDDDKVYIDLSKVPAHVELPPDGQMVFTLPKPGSGQIMGVPGPVMAWPTAISPHLVTLRQECLERVKSYKPNRFITGQAYEEARDATGTAFLEATAQARRPYDRLLSQSDLAIQRSIEYDHHAIRYWDAVMKGDEQRRWYAVASGNEAMLYNESNRGEMVYISADKLDNTDYQIQLVTQNETLAEQVQRRLIALQGFQAGILDTEQLIREWGYADPIAQMVRLKRQQLRAQADGPLTEAEVSFLMMRMQQEAGIVLPFPLAPQGAGPQGAGTPPTPPGGPGAPQLPSPGRLQNTPIDQAPVPGPTGGGNPVGNGAPLGLA